MPAQPTEKEVQKYTAMYQMELEALHLSDPEKKEEQ